MLELRPSSGEKVEVKKNLLGHRYMHATGGNNAELLMRHFKSLSGEELGNFWVKTCK